MKKLLPIALLSSVIALQTGCSFMKKDKTGSSAGSASVIDETQTVTQGLGSRAGLNGSDLNADSIILDNCTTRAPANQVYYFDFDNDAVHQRSIRCIEAQARYLVAHPNAKVLVAGNTDERGSREYNVALGLRRAITVDELLRLSGVRPYQIRRLSYGEEKPRAFGHTARDYQENRRVELSYEAKG